MSFEKFGLLQVGPLYQKIEKTEVDAPKLLGTGEYSTFHNRFNILHVTKECFDVTGGI